MVDAAGTTRFAYTSAGLLLSEDGPWANDTVSYTYTNRLRLGLSLQRPTGPAWTVAYAHDAAGRLTNLTSPAGAFGYEYSSGVGSATTPATLVRKLSLPGGSFITNTFARTNLSLADGDNTFTAIAQDGYGRFATNTVAVYLPASPSFAYDANGNLTNDGRRVFQYDDENQLVNVQVANAWRSEFMYDGRMRRRLRKEFAWRSGAWVQTNEVRYVYDGNLAIQERNENNLPVATYTRGRDLSGSLSGAGGIGGLLARTDNALLISQPSAAHACYHADGNGNITALADGQGQIVARYLYDPYGNLLAQSGPMADANLYRFSSKEWNPSSCLVYYLYRYCDLVIQRWLTPDPVKESGGINLFTFVHNNPLYYHDPLGFSASPNTNTYRIGSTNGTCSVSTCPQCTKRSCYSALEEEDHWPYNENNCDANGHTGYIIRTGADGYAVLRINNSHNFYIRPNSSISTCSYSRPLGYAPSQGTPHG